MKKVKRATFEEAFADVLKLSPEELLNCPIDTFISEAFNVFEEMDFCSNKRVYNIKINLDSSVFLHRKIFFSTDIYLHIEKNLMDNSIIIYNNYILSRPFQIFGSNLFRDGAESVKNSIQEENEVEQWLLAA